MNASFVSPSREFDARALALLFGTQHRSLIFPRATRNVIRLVDMFSADNLVPIYRYGP